MLWAAGLGAMTALIAGLLAAYAAYQVNFAIPKRAAELSEQLDAQLMQQVVSAWPTRLLVRDGWRPEKTISDLTVYVRHPAPESTGVQPTSMQIRRGEQTLVWAEAVPFGERYVWPFDEVSELFGRRG